ncbi:MAG: SIR2 family protein [Clostridiales bacterium]|nr:SIR2 family protein [Clostridiales bacterium]
MNCECAICKSNKPFDMPKEIVEAAIKGDLVLFCGAGISTESKSVLPYSFYTEIKQELSLNENLSFCQLMQLYCDQPNGRKLLLKKIRKRFSYINSFPELERSASSFHRELAELYPIRTIITTNWDTYFEEYCAAIPITIPEDFAYWDDSERFVLKIHGSINNLSTIIATEDDYNKCYQSLQKGIIGATLKHILAIKTVVFIGFSFGDDDLNQIIEYLQKEMGDIYPHIYLVTLDETLKDRINYKNCTSIVTSGTFFIHSFKNILISKGIIKNTSIYSQICTVLGCIKELHEKAAQIDLQKHPCSLYNLAYQDGVIHSFERYLQNYNTGEYCDPNRISCLVCKYEQIKDKSFANGNYWDEAYYEGYINGLVLISEIEEDAEAVKEFPFIYLPNARRALTSYEAFFKELDSLSTEEDEYCKYANSIVKNYTAKDIIVHHPPY